jgi:hypothetical protein
MAINRAKHPRSKFVPPKVEDPPSDAQKQIFLDELSSSIKLFQARTQAGWTRAQLDEAMKDPAFAAARKDVEADFDNRVKYEVYRKAIIDGNPEMLKIIAQSKLAHEFGAKSKVEVSFTDKKIADLSLDEATAILEQHKK